MGINWRLIIWFGLLEEWSFVELDQLLSRLLWESRSDKRVDYKGVRYCRRQNSKDEKKNSLVWIPNPNWYDVPYFLTFYSSKIFLELTNKYCIPIKCANEKHYKITWNDLETLILCFCNPPSVTCSCETHPCKDACRERFDFAKPCIMWLLSPTLCH